MIFFISAESKQHATCLPQCEMNSGLGNVLVENDNNYYTRKTSLISIYCGLVEECGITDHLPINNDITNLKNI
jgi:hypothetical protein